MQILAEPKGDGYPLEYVITRVRARLNNQRLSDTSNESEEIKWLFYQMNPFLRDIFRTVFTYLELKKLFTALRFKMGGLTDYFDILNLSIFSEEICTAFMREANIYRITGFIMSKAGNINKGGEPLEQIFARKGLKVFEECFYSCFLEYAEVNANHPVINGFFKYKIDQRNITGILKHIRWKMDSAPQFVKGGSVDIARLKKIFSERNLEALAEIMEELTTLKPDLNEVENTFNRGLLKHLKKQAKETIDISVILYYILKIHVELLDRMKTIYH